MRFDDEVNAIRTDKFFTDFKYEIRTGPSDEDREMATGASLISGGGCHKWPCPPAASKLCSDPGYAEWRKQMESALEVRFFTWDVMEPKNPGKNRTRSASSPTWRMAVTAASFISVNWRCRIQDAKGADVRIMSRFSLKPPSWILQRQLTEMKEAAVVKI